MRSKKGHFLNPAQIKVARIKLKKWIYNFYNNFSGQITVYYNDII